MTIADAMVLLEAALTRLRHSSDGLIRIDDIEGRAIQLLLDASRATSGSVRGQPTEVSEVPLGTPVERGNVEFDLALVSVPDQPCEIDSVGLDLSAAETTFDEDPSAIACLDFGTAFSKAYAMRDWDEPVDIELGAYAGASHPFMVESSVWIDNDGVFFGPDALARSEDIVVGRRRLDSVKTRLAEIERSMIPPVPVGDDINPWAGQIEFTEIGLLTLYLAYVNHLLSVALEAEGMSRHLPRRIARPCWDEDTAGRMSPLLRRLMAKSIIIADTLRDDLADGLSVSRAAGVLSEVDQVDDETLFPIMFNILRQDLSEPEAVAAPFEAESDWHFLTVVDVGAGTTDVATFLLRANPKWDRSKIRLVPNSRGSLNKAGDEIDRILFEHLLDRISQEDETIDTDALETWLRATIRDHKLQLFRDEALEVSFGDVEIDVYLEDFLEFEEVKAFRDDLVDMIQRSFQDVPEIMAKRLVEKGGPRLLLSGGGATMPMVKSLSECELNGRAGTIRFRPTEARPGWESSKDADFHQVYPQLAVAVGGASPDLPESDG